MFEWLFRWLSGRSEPDQIIYATLGRGRDSRWSKARAAHLLKEPSCQVCGGVKDLQVHHKVPVHVDPERELDPDNLMTLCMQSSRACHFVFGHLYDWRAYNPTAGATAAHWQQVLARKRYADPPTP